ncbi:hypothetical protein CkaCkLH20_07842 [Colletotrichum karsti]|uniref:Cyanovirin-N domain-containing protein n=1 Tax=Colletotrichum karsti TaxID=1095194 RepID=A0A9P6I9W9_9PEZI|nr:uncharacterized protein CkaCkLH20_07842 [Colletotrichum karsti]KAF9874705.1 hypothetical protein CkaCkLH20_07842 [Colletotrichum karsti]
MRLQASIILAIAGLASAGSTPSIPSSKLPPSEEPDKCLQRLDEYPNRSDKREDLFHRRCVEARTYRGKYGPYSGDLYLESCCKNADGKFTTPTFINFDECLVFDPDTEALQWNHEKTRRIRDHCNHCEIKSMYRSELICYCKNKDGNDVKAQLTFDMGSIHADIESLVPKNALWVDKDGQFACKQ